MPKDRSVKLKLHRHPVTECAGGYPDPAVPGENHSWKYWRGKRPGGLSISIYAL